ARRRGGERHLARRDPRARTAHRPPRADHLLLCDGPDAARERRRHRRGSEELAPPPRQHRQTGRRGFPGIRRHEPAGRSSEGPLAVPPPVSPASALQAVVRAPPLHDALETARAHQPQLRQAHADTEAAGAVADEARAPLLPQITATASYARATTNDIA